MRVSRSPPATRLRIARPATADGDQSRSLAAWLDSIGLIRFQRRRAEECLRVDVLDRFDASTLRPLEQRLLEGRTSRPQRAVRETHGEARAHDAAAPHSRRDRRRAARRAAAQI